MPKLHSNIPPVPSAIRHLVYLLCFWHGLLSPIGATGPVDQSTPDSLFLQNIPTRPRDAITGIQFGRETTGLTGRERQTRALDELLRGNVPDFLRKLKPVHLSYSPPPRGNDHSPHLGHTGLSGHWFG